MQSKRKELKKVKGSLIEKDIAPFLTEQKLQDGHDAADSQI